MAKYRINDIEYPSVTTVLGILGKGDALVQWAANCAIDYIKENPDCDLEVARKEWRNVRDDAMNIGSEVHHLIEKWIKRDEIIHDIENDIVEKAFNAFREWERENIQEWIETEQTVHRRDLGYAGTLDAVAKMKDGRVLVIDFKVSKGFYDTYPLQLAAYRAAYEKDVDGMGILLLDKKSGLPKFKEYNEYARLFACWVDLLNFYYKFKKRRLKNNNRA